MIRFIFLSFSIITITSCATFQEEHETQRINQLLDAWHQAAAVADEETFFNTFTQDGIYIGTDASEYWKATELQQWAKSAFDKDVAWAFQPHDRHIYFSEDKKTVWFDELLKTWMGPCRGSGVLQKENGQWKLAHYHLAVAVPNEVIEDYLKLLPKDEIKP